MLDIDYSPGVFAVMIVITIVCPAIYGIFFVDEHWKKNQQEDDGDDAFN